MSLPNDVARCIGQAYDQGPICEHRDTCRRFVSPPSSIYVGYMHPQVPGPCIYHIPTSKEGQP